MTRGEAPARVLFRCDATAAMGGGHVMRCLAPANALAGAGAQIAFVSAAMPEALAKRIADAGHRLAPIPPSPEMQREGPAWEEPSLSAEAQLADATATGATAGPADWLVVDHYLLDASWHSAARAFADRILVIDDLANRSYDCDILLDQTLGRSKEDYGTLVPGGAKILAGPIYAMLRPEFARERSAALARRQSGGPARRVLVSMGTADSGGVTARVVEQLLTVAPECAIDVVLGPQAQSLEAVRVLAASRSQISVNVNSDRMAELMRDADFAIGAAGMTSWERCCLGLPSIMLVLADNQRAGAEALAASGAALFADHINEIATKLNLLVENAEARARMSAAAFAITDGLGTGRLVEAMLGEETANSIVLRPATLADSQMLWLWRNDPPTRANSRTSEPIIWQDHVKWLHAALERADGCFLVAERSGFPVGTVRFDPLDEGGHEVNIAIAPEGRGSGCGKELLREACVQMGQGAIYASVREDNVPSRRLFEACGFVEIDSAEPGFLRYLLAMKNSVAAQRNKT